MDVISLFSGQNRCIERLVRLTREFVELLKSDPTDPFSEIDPLYKKREYVIQAFGLFEKKITQWFDEIPTFEERKRIANTLKPVLTPILEQRKQILRELTFLDQKIFDKIQEEKSKICDEMGSIRKMKQTVSKFKSIWVSEAGEGIDTTL